MYKFNVQVGPKILFCIEHENEDVIEIPGFPMPKSKESADVKLVDIFGKDKFKNAYISYEYDFGDGWEHSIKFLGEAAEILEHPICLGGEGHPCAEDCGGPGGWEELKALYKKKKLTKEAKTTKDWYESGGCVNGDEEGLADPALGYCSC
eukprot:Phypoly_transcript_19303.p1 GENE.Phypoly_transcript_19303~~Phypoly_transcript_19303.p1  ORF type:complete len:150 (+),score=35.48 Phypoly_transcript_19303:191-640(+)